MSEMTGKKQKQKQKTKQNLTELNCYVLKSSIITNNNSNNNDNKFNNHNINKTY